MSREELSKDIERMLQNQLNAEVPEFTNESWKRMEILLDRDVQEKKKRIFFIWFFGFAGLILGVAGYLWYDHKNEHTFSTSSQVAMNKSSKDIGNNRLEVNSNLIKFLDNELNNLYAEEKGDNSTLAQSKKINMQPALSNNDYDEQSIAQDKSINNAPPMHSSDQSGSPDAKIFDHITKDSLADQNQENNPLIVEKKETAVAFLPLAPLTDENQFSLLFHEQSFTSPDFLHNKSRDRWSLIIGVGRRWASTHSFERYDGDNEINVLLGYRFSDRFTLRTGINYISEYYHAEKEDYHPPRGFWTRMIAPENTNAMCRMLEMPILMEYGLSNSLTISAGVSSTLMWQENYYYEYVEPYNDLVESWMGTWKNAHLLSHGVFSIGYGYKNVSIVPYLVLPIKGIGHGNISLRATGVRLNYRIF